ncbi:hypothetical protein [Streptomyces fulvoviolaceus]|uniref:hypothetical protein n=1 Tax=Streptomyces fulvoviolaceus TaxID=285535 RepID=UPI0021C24D00|nr:hypothetical protein [Streptomyces fulvoviolaceus]MCT9077005.1 hypothetical protein [Streptomyces fulvoviolaceus]
MQDSLQPLYEAFMAVRHPRNLIRWIAHSPSAQMLAQTIATGGPLSHEALDELPPGYPEFFIRQALVHTGVLPARQEDLERLPVWLEQVLADRPAAHGRLIRPFVHWALLRRARRLTTTRRHPAFSHRYLRTPIFATLALLAWLDDRGLALELLDQSTLDRWLADGNTVTYTIRYFLAWTEARGITQHLTVPPRQQQEPVQTLDEDQHWQLLRRCLTDDAMPLDARSAGALMLLFGLPLVRIRHLTTSHLDSKDSGSFLNIGQHPLLLPPRVAELLQELVRTHRPRSMFGPSTSDRQWLFPGINPGQPISDAAMRIKLRGYAIAARSTRNAALIALAADIPAPVLADLLDLHPTTAVRWAARAKRDWTSYLAARAEDLERRNTAPSE